MLRRLNGRSWKRRRLSFLSQVDDSFHFGQAWPRKIRRASSFAAMNLNAWMNSSQDLHRVTLTPVERQTCSGNSGDQAAEDERYGAATYTRTASTEPGSVDVPLQLLRIARPFPRHGCGSHASAGAIRRRPVEDGHHDLLPFIEVEPFHRFEHAVGKFGSYG